ncbi:site-specific DNA-methyltransferase [Mycoplasma mycoides]|uniref:site-specific DNA-methyltransferase n=1 Tax=Mycoplasma mycoides TaxID=2102 RepID=UPI00223ED9CF|nr:site-specific DNA-methyltransferase [Mycoplasma mycoides]QVK02547.1 site-specific DNA-methyltransferase [Mycoplasma mycoides subsp. capri]QVK03362.1 site-specific DNA-methyltransferase [Mycoplasma mycoides subsp. capri]QVK08255.1 site-specific DNA-methyltransferase [Mycoplasma mycoides subsp. capri]QVK09612.1 site-specific DNA-methyltransferase [Mycoplasma mycoides subsp. capri]
MQNRKQDYINKINELTLNNELNQDQKNLIISILDKFDDNDINLHNVYQFLIKRVKLGFTFDIAPSVDAKQVAILSKDEKLSFKNSDKDNNVLIIGENYDALKNLKVVEREREREQGAANFDVIYIDPPYNTESSLIDGNNLSEKDDISNKKFIYRDKFSRTGWLNMLNERLIMAHQLLKDDGIIFVSIDDTEHAYLKVLMDEIFGEENFVANIVWVSNKKGRQISNSLFSKTYEHILAYGKNVSSIDYEFSEEWEKLHSTMPSIYDEKVVDILEDQYGEFIVQNELHNTAINNFNIYNRPNLYYPIYVDENNISTEFKPELVEIFPPVNGNGVKGVWRWSKEKVEKDKYNLFVKKSGSTFKIYTKVREFTYKIKDVILSPKITTKSGNNELVSILKNAEFNTTKPTELIKLLVMLHPNKNARVLDFYAGSGTTGHAVLELNRQDNGNRTFTLVTNNENNIGIDVCYERLFRINNGKSTDNKTDFKWIEKNKSYLSNLDVFNIDYYSTKLFENTSDTKIIKDKFIKMLNDLKIDYSDINTIRILRQLTSLKPIVKE